MAFANEQENIFNNMISAIDKLRREFIEKLVERYFKQYPEHLKDAKKRAHYLSTSRAKAVGTDKKMEFRFEFTIPKKLYERLDIAVGNPRFLGTKTEADWFAKKYKKLFTVPEKW